jgi:hypothetical protein
VTREGAGTASQTSAAADAPAIAETNGAPSGQPAQGGSASSKGTATSSDNAPPAIIINGNNPAQMEWPLNQIWNDNLGALFTHAGQSTTIYSTSTIDVTVSGTSTVDYWTEVPSTEHWLHTTRTVVIQGAANDNAPIVRLAATGTDATSTAQ